MPINRARGRTSSGSDEEEAGDAVSNDKAVGKNDLGPSTVTLSGLLNAIDGVSSQVSLTIRQLITTLADAGIGRLGTIRFDELPRQTGCGPPTTRSIRRAHRIRSRST